MLANPSAGIYAWTDLDPTDASSGPVEYEETRSAGQTRTTWRGVVLWGTSDPITVQIDYNVATGDWAITFEAALATTGPEDWLIGYSPAGASADPDNVDLSTGGPFATAAADTLPLLLEANGNPTQGAMPTTVTATTSRFDPAPCCTSAGSACRKPASRWPPSVRCPSARCTPAST